MPNTPLPLSLVLDLGATNARFALVDEAGVRDIKVLPCAAHRDLASAAKAYLSGLDLAEPPRQAAMAVASPVTGDVVSLTNLHWSFRIADMAADLALDRLEMVNDFTAVALSVTSLEPGDRRQVGGGGPRPDQPIGVIGPGTGLGVSALVPGPSGWTALASEGGHVSFAPATNREAAVLQYLWGTYPHVSAERVCSGAGLVNLYRALSAIDGRALADDVRPHQVTDAALAQSDEHAIEAVEMMCAVLGTTAGNLALTVGAHGGVYIAGGIVPRFGKMLDRSPFRERFEAKGRLRDFLVDIPTYLITAQYPAFLGLKAVLQRTE